MLSRLSRLLASGTARPRSACRFQFESRWFRPLFLSVEANSSARPDVTVLAAMTGHFTW
jgi:hypothetical protein